MELGDLPGLTTLGALAAKPIMDRAPILCCIYIQGNMVMLDQL